MRCCRQQALLIHLFGSLPTGKRVLPAVLCDGEILTAKIMEEMNLPFSDIFYATESDCLFEM